MHDMLVDRFFILHTVNKDKYSPELIPLYHKFTKIHITVPANCLLNIRQIGFVLPADQAVRCGFSNGLNAVIQFGSRRAYECIQFFVYKINSQRTEQSNCSLHKYDPSGDIGYNS
ncbi:hypothetical protein D3C73_866470 [compost metagenome]